MKLALSPTTPGMSAADLVALCVRAEELGYPEAWAAEVAGPEAFSLLGGIAAATSRLDLGVAVVPSATRSPALLTMAAATISQLLGGRTLSLGVGASSEFILRNWHGGDFHPPLARVAEAVAAVRSLLSGEASYVGEHLKVERFRLAGNPAGPVRLFVGALGPKMLGLSGAVGDGVCLNLMPPRLVPAQRSAVESGAAAAGRELDESFTVMARLHVVPTGDRKAGRHVVRSAFGPYFGQPVYNRFLAWMGWEEEAETIRHGFAEGDREAVARAMHDELVDEIAVVGDSALIAERLAEYQASGLDVGALGFIAEPPEVVKALEDLASITL